MAAGMGKRDELQYLVKVYAHVLYYFSYFIFS